MLQNAYFVAKIGADTAENEQHTAEILPIRPCEPACMSGAARGTHADAGGDAEAAPARQRRQRASVGKISAKCCSFSAVSAPIFASKYALVSIFQNLPDYLAEIFEIWQNFAKFAEFAKFSLSFHKNADFSNRFFLRKF